MGVVYHSLDKDNISILDRVIYKLSVVIEYLIGWNLWLEYTRVLIFQHHLFGFLVFIVRCKV